MKQYNIITLASLVVLGVSCSDFLNIPSETSLSSETYYKTQSDFEQAVNGAYAPLRGLYNGNEGAWAMGELRSDNTTYKFNPNDRGTIQGEYIKDFIEESDNTIPLNKWVSNYSIISRVNYLLEPIDDITFDEGVKRNLKGQALFLRSFAYLDLVQYFGSVPLHLKPVKSEAEATLPLSSVEQIYHQIILDAGTASQMLPGKDEQESERATKGAAQMVLANVYINLKQWEKADSVLNQITGYELLADYNSVFDTNNKNNKESIFEIQYKEGTEGYASSFFYTFLPQPITAEEISAITGITENSRNVEGYNIPTPDIIAAYEPGDLRKDISVGILTANGEPCPYIKKYCHSHALSGNTNDNWPVYRYAETLLFKAEVANELDRPEDALQYLNEVRNRAGLTSSAASTKEEIREAIFQERRVELAFENKRWLDLVRSGKAEEVMKAYGKRVKSNPQAYYFPEGYTVASSAYLQIPLLFDLPASEAALNPYF